MNWYNTIDKSCLGENMKYIGLDIGGTKCAVSLGQDADTGFEVLERREFPTAGLSYQQVLERFSNEIARILQTNVISRIGISCGGPLDSRRGIILSPPNLPGWDSVEITRYFEDRFSVPTMLQNDANACAVAEWLFGAGKGCRNLVFLTFGTGLGAGLILDGKLYSGTNDNAGEIGHIRLAPEGPVGYGKAGSMEGFCSGGGIAQLGVQRCREAVVGGEQPLLLREAGSYDRITAKLIGQLGDRGDELCRSVYQTSGEMLGRGLSILIDLINPEVIIIGGVFMRSGHLLLPHAERVIRAEALSLSGQICRILPAGLGEKVGDFAALAVAKGMD